MRNRATTPLSKAKVRQSWSKYNLYNLSRITTPTFRGKTFFQIKWLSKSVLRSYHGEQVREVQWQKMFKRRLRAVVPMNPDYLAINDGSLESAGRGSGMTKIGGRAPEQTPYMQMTFAPLERRLDTAIFRAMFASSARQARQFVVHGAVKVNGKKMHYPGYLLNPGDLFQVEPERVMYATGAAKAPALPAQPVDGEEASEQANEDQVRANEVEADAEDEADIDIERDPRVVLKDLQAQAKSILASPRSSVGAKKKQDLRAFTKAIKRMMSRSKSSTILTDSLEAQFEELKQQLKIQREQKRSGRNTLPSQQSKDKKAQDESVVEAKAASVGKGEDVEKSQEGEDDTNTLTDKEYNELFAALAESHDNPIDDSKPYATPWRPRDYMSAFSFIPRYLEVNQNICAAVYLRHPVAKPGLAEVPTPFKDDTNSAAFVWYLRRR